MLCLRASSTAARRPEPNHAGDSLLPRTAALDSARLLGLNMVSGDPLGIKGLPSRSGISIGAGALSLLGSLGAALGGTTRLALLREVGGDPDVVEEVHDTDEAGEEENVEEDARTIKLGSDHKYADEEGSHLRIKDASVGFDNADGLVESRYGEEVTLAVSDDSGKVQPEVLGVHVGDEGVGQGLLRARRNLSVVTGGSEVANVFAWFLERPETASDEVDADGVLFLVGESQESFGRVAIDELHAKDLGGWERSRDGDCQLGDLDLLLSILSGLLHTELACTRMEVEVSQGAYRVLATDKQSLQRQQSQ